MGQTDELVKHAAANEPTPDVLSYMAMRKTIGIGGIALPWLVVAGARIFAGYAQKDSISAYYYSNTRDVFVGLLCMVGVFLFSYKGFDRLDAVVTNICGLLAIGVAVFPTQRGDQQNVPVGLLNLNDQVSRVVHYVCAVSLLVLLASISGFLFTRTAKGKKPTRQKLARNGVYRACGGIMFAALAIGGLLSLPPLARFAPQHLLFWVESISLSAFGVSWLIKGEALLADVEAPADGPAGAGAAALN